MIWRRDTLKDFHTLLDGTVIHNYYRLSKNLVNTWPTERVATLANPAYCHVSTTRCLCMCLAMQGHSHGCGWMDVYHRCSNCKSTFVAREDGVFKCADCGARW